MQTTINCSNFFKNQYLLLLLFDANYLTTSPLKGGLFAYLICVKDTINIEEVKQYLAKYAKLKLSTITAYSVTSMPCSLSLY